MDSFLPEIPFFCIHLLRETSREAYMTHFQNSLRRPVTVWQASEGTDVLTYNWPRGHPHEAQTSIGALGCVDSHIRLLHRMCDQEWDMMGIFEDDAEIVVDIKKLQEFYDHACAEKPEWDFLILGANEWVDWKPTQSGMVQPTRFWGTHAFLIRKTAAKKVLELFYELQKRGYTYPADWLYSAALSQKGLVAYGPSVCRSMIRQKPGVISAINGKIRT